MRSNNMICKITSQSFDDQDFLYSSRLHLRSAQPLICHKVFLAWGQMTFSIAWWTSLTNYFHDKSRDFSVSTHVAGKQKYLHVIAYLRNCFRVSYQTLLDLLLLKLLCGIYDARLLSLMTIGGHKLHIEEGCKQKDS